MKLGWILGSFGLDVPQEIPSPSRVSDGVRQGCDIPPTNDPSLLFNFLPPFPLLFDASLERHPPHGFYHAASTQTSIALPDTPRLCQLLPADTVALAGGVRFCLPAGESSAGGA